MAAPRSRTASPCPDAFRPAQGPGPLILAALLTWAPPPVLGALPSTPGPFPFGTHPSPDLAMTSARTTDDTLPKPDPWNGLGDPAFTPLGPEGMDPIRLAAAFEPGSASLGLRESTAEGELEPNSPAPDPIPGPSAAAEKEGWAMAPIRWGGTLSYGLRQQHSDSSGNSTENLFEFRGRATSYVVEPWIARIAADFSLAYATRSQTDDASPASANLRGITLTGTGTVNVFPLSRFPFQASLSVSDSRTDGALVNDDYTRTRLSLRQEFRPEQDSWSSFAQFDRSELQGRFGKDIVDRLAAGFMFNRPGYTLNLDGSLARNVIGLGGSATEMVINARHSLRVDEALSFESLTSYTDTERSGVPGVMDGRTRNIQGFTFGNWTPVDSPWRATTSLRYLRTASTFGDSRSALDVMAGSGSLAYRVDANLDTFANVAVNVARSGGTQDVSSVQGIGANYNSDALAFGNYSYNWYATAHLNRVNVSAGSQQVLTTNTGHALQRTWSLTDSTALFATAGQSISHQQATGLDALSATTLTHSASLSLRAQPQDALQGYIGLNLSDNRSRGDIESSFQLANLQLTGAWRMDARSEFSASLTLQRSRQSYSVPGFGGTTASETTRSQDNSVSGNLSYSHRRFFNLPNLQYLARFTANTYRSSSRLSGDPDAPRELVTRDLDQHLVYRIGRLNAELQLRQAEVDGKKNALLFLKISRDFGAF